VSAWEQTVDNGRFRCWVEYDADGDGYAGTLHVVVDATEEVLLETPTGIAYAARFGPDVEDVGRWQTQSLEVIDGWLERHGETPPQSEETETPFKAPFFHDDGSVHDEHCPCGHFQRGGEMTTHLKCTMTGAGLGDGTVKLPVSVYLQDIYSLLRNGVNTQVILVKEDGRRVTYELARDEEVTE
jgi:hypothetical protein